MCRQKMSYKIRMQIYGKTLSSAEIKKKKRKMKKNPKEIKVEGILTPVKEEEALQLTG